MSRTPLVVLAAGAVALAVASPRDAPSAAADAAPGPRLVIIGGGDRPPEALARFVGWAGGASSRILVIPWGSGEPAESCEAILSELAAVKARSAAGVVFGGTSAGAAVMSARMITGDGDFTVIDGEKVGVRPGLGLVEGVIVDQHFVKRQRQNRLFGLVLKHPGERGVGIDEDTALLVTGGRYAEVVGRGPVVLVDAKGSDRLEVTLLRAGQRTDLRQRP